MTVVHNILAIPFLIGAWICDWYLLLILFRAVARLPSLRATVFARAVGDLADPLNHRVSRGLAALHPRIASPRITYLTTFVVLLLLRYALLSFVVAVS